MSRVQCSRVPDGDKYDGRFPAVGCFLHREDVGEFPSVVSFLHKERIVQSYRCPSVGFRHRCPIRMAALAKVAFQHLWKDRIVRVATER